MTTNLWFPIVHVHVQGIFFFQINCQCYNSLLARKCWFATADRQNYGLLINGTSSMENANCELRYFVVNFRRFWIAFY